MILKSLGIFLLKNSMIYFEKVELSNNKDFSTLLQKFMQSLDDKVSKYIEKSPRKKNAEIEDIPRARKYYNKIIEFKKQN